MKTDYILKQLQYLRGERGWPDSPEVLCTVVMREGLIRGKIANEHHCDPATYVWVLARLDGIREMNALAETPH